MDLSADSSIDELLARSQVENHGTFSIVSVAGFSKLPKPKQAQIMDRMQQHQDAPFPDPERLASTLRSITPPPDEELEKELCRSLEAESRIKLEDEGCPPCYPPDLEIPLRNVPEQYRPIISYWESFPGTGNVVLRAQLSDWQRFRKYQKMVRDYYLRRPFNDFTEQVRKRRRRHTLGGDIHLQLEVKAQSQLQNWIEFQDYHLQTHKGLEKERDDLMMKMDFEDLKEVKDTDCLGFDPGRISQRNLGHVERRLQRHQTMLQWIEQMREEMCIVDENTKQAEVRSHMKRGKTSTSMTKPALKDSAASSQCNILPARKDQGNKLLRPRTEVPLLQRHPHRVFKLERAAHARLAKDQVSASITTRSGRISRRPIRWTPE